jgi:hypothetical protein
MTEWERWRDQEDVNRRVGKAVRYGVYAVCWLALGELVLLVVLLAR